jgi:hypothetical protein
VKIYDVFIKQNAQNSKIEDVLLVKAGFNWQAFLFSIFWFLFNRLWLFSFLFLMYCFMVNIFLSSFASKVFIVLTNVVLGFEAENILVYRFRKENYYFVGIAMGRDEDEAKVKFLEDINKQNKDDGKVIF